MGFRKNIRDYFASSHMGYLPSRFSGESFPLVIIDCLQSGKPVIASDMGEISNMLNGPDGISGCVFSLEEGKIPIHKVAENIAKYATDEKLYKNICKAVAGACEKFKPEELLNSYDNVYVNVLNNKLLLE